MTKEAEYGHKLRILLVMRMLIEQPYRFTKKELAARFGVSRDTISNDFDDFRNAGYELECDKKYRYGFTVDQPYQALRDLLQFTEKEQWMLIEALDQTAPHSPRAAQLKRKLANIYDYKRLGFENLRKPYLTKVNLLEQAKEQQVQIVLKNYYSSNSNTISDRHVEPFHPSPEDDILHAYDVSKDILRHFRISRITRIQVTDIPWQYPEKHIIHPTDPFRIVDSQQILVHLRFKVGARNELVERFPLTKGYLQEAAEEAGVFDFQCKVNHRFLGLSNFILGNYHQLVEVVEPESLKEHLRREVGRMEF